ncbi:MAG TPA: hypothetical protein VFD58_04960 [Blastocatellia bacterium]|nr:hypothetical protein [Blastocatellia bacterium]
MRFGRSAIFAHIILFESRCSVRSFRKLSPLSLIIPFLLLFVSTVTTPAQTTRTWQLTGPFGGDVSSLAVDPRDGDHVIIGTHDGQIFKSTDGGSTWHRVRPGLRMNGFEIKRFMFDRERAGVVYAGLVQIRDARDDSSGGGISRSTDGGETWSEIEVMRGRSVRNLVQSASDPDVIVVAARDGIYRSSDRGENWERITPESDPELRGFHSVAIDPRDAKIIYVGTWHLPWKTADGGLTWKRAGSKENGMIDDSDIFAIQVDEKNPDNVMMSACSGIYRSLDASAKWAKIQGIPYTSRRTHVIYQHPTRPEVIFAGTTEGLWRTTDGGKTWGIVSSPRLIINAIAVHPEKPNRIYVGTEDMGVMISEDGGENYVLSNAGFISRQVRTVLADSSERGRLYAGVIFDGAGGGIFISEDGGTTWQQSNKGLGVRDVYSLYQDPSNPKTIYAGTNHGLFRSDDQGRNWVAVKRAESEIKALAGKPGTGKGPVSTPDSGSGPKKAISSTARTGAAISGSRVKRVVQTRVQATAKPASDKKNQAGAAGDQSSKPVLFDLQSQVFAIAPLIPGSESEPKGLVAATWDGLYRTTDEKKGWEPLALSVSSQVVAASKPVSPIVRTVATSPHAPGLILAGTEEGIFISRNNGGSFTPSPLDGELRRIQTIVFDPRSAETIYVGTSNAFFRSTDGGQTWERRGGGLRLASSVSAIAINPANPNELYVGDYNQGGFYRSIDRGRNWEMLNINDLPSQRLWSLVADPFDAGRMYAGSFSSGVYVVTKQAESK